ncbi:MAG: hypothetical protein ABIC95_06360 [archaeon]
MKRIETGIFRYGMILLGFIMAGLLIAFALKASYTIDIDIDHREQHVEGDSETIITVIPKLCDACMSKRDVDRDCYLLYATITDGQITADDLSIYNMEDLDVPGAGNYIFKIQSEENNCTVRQIG